MQPCISSAHAYKRILSHYLAVGPSTQGRVQGNLFSFYFALLETFYLLHSYRLTEYGAPVILILQYLLFRNTSARTVRQFRVLGSVLKYLEWEKWIFWCAASMVHHPFTIWPTC